MRSLGYVVRHNCFLSSRGNYSGFRITINFAKSNFLQMLHVLHLEYDNYFLTDGKGKLQEGVAYELIIRSMVLLLG